MPLRLEARQPAMQSRPIRPICLSNLRNEQALIQDSTHRPNPNIVARITHNQRRSFAHNQRLLQLRCFQSIAVLQKYWNGPAITRKIRLLRAHGLLERIPNTHRYLVPLQAHKAITALLATRDASIDQLTQSAA